MIIPTLRYDDAAGGIESQHVAQVLDAGHDEAHAAPYLVMEFLSGEDLHQIILREAGPYAHLMDRVMLVDP